MKLQKSADSSRPPVSIISLSDKKTLRSIFQKILDQNPANGKLRRKIFSQIARRSNLQQVILKFLAQHAEAQASLIQELARIPQLRREILVLACDQSYVPRSRR
jgi:formate dehydrogenase maturation protein FdhE